MQINGFFTTSVIHPVSHTFSLCFYTKTFTHTVILRLGETLGIEPLDNPLYLPSHNNDVSETEFKHGGWTIILHHNLHKCSLYTCRTHLLELLQIQSGPMQKKRRVVQRVRYTASRCLMHCCFWFLYGICWQSEKPALLHFKANEELNRSTQST